VAQLPKEEPVPSTLDWDAWLGPQAMRPYSSAYLPFNWRGWYDFGAGAPGDMACHILGAPNMALRLTAPTSVEVIKRDGKNPYTFPTQSVTRFDFPARGASLPALTLYWYDGMQKEAWRPESLAAGEQYVGGPDGLGAPPPNPNTPPRGRSNDGRGGTVSSAANGAAFVGEKGIITTDTYAANVRLLPESRMKEYKLPAQYLTRSPGHYRDWIRACKGGERSCSDFRIAGPLTEWIVLGSIALHAEGKLEWDAARMRITNNSDANKLVKPKFRKGWELKL